VSRDLARRDLRRELSKRYGADYQLVSATSPRNWRRAIRKVKDTGAQIALVIGGLGGQDPDGIETLAAVRTADADGAAGERVPLRRLRILQPLFDAIAQGKIDHWVPARRATATRSSTARSPSS
jgi:hypothetical protein